MGLYEFKTNKNTKLGIYERRQIWEELGEGMSMTKV